MDQFNRSFTPPREARLDYGDAQYHVIAGGDYVRCAVTGQRIPLACLCYWSVERQEAYIDADAAARRHEALNA